MKKTYVADEEISPLTKINYYYKKYFIVTNFKLYQSILC